jgi:hypothetical protein
MAIAKQIQSLIIRQLSGREMGVLNLVVAVRRTFHASKAPKGNLTELVKSALRSLVASNAVVDDDGMYSLRRRVQS